MLMASPKRDRETTEMDLNYSAEDLAFRDEVRGWLDANIPADLREKVLNYEELGKEDLLRWHGILARKGWVAPAWPVEHGGTGWNAVQRYIFEEECAAAGAPPIVAFGMTMCGPVLIRFGSDEQKKRHLPGIYNGEVFWCQGYSEPGSGSDLASLKTRAERQGDHYIVNGQKIWTTLGHFGDWIFCLVRTDPNAKKQEGISFLLIDMNAPGITVRPLILLDEGHEVNEVFFENVKVPAENLVYEENKGWTVAKYLLGHERLNTGRIGGSKRELAKLKAMAAKAMRNGRPLAEDTRFADRLARVEIELMALEVTNLRFLDEMMRTGNIGPEVAMLKIKGTEIQQALTELTMQAAGPMAQAFKPVDYDGFDAFTASLAARYFNYRKTSIYAGSNEIQRNIYSKAVLGL
ncbi:acyl-CoA dehydrogenase family protein [Quisquiliibacterium transsilvanicum]